MDSTFPPQQSTDQRTADLAAARLIRAAAISARTAGSIDTPLPLLTDAELNAPISVSDSDPYVWEGKQLLIRGYKVGSEIDSGGQATVYRGVQETTGRQVAIKIIPGGPFVSSRRRSRFDREAKLLASFDHPNIVGIVDRGRTEDGSFFIVMDLIEGPPLDQYWTRFEGQPEMLARLFAKIAYAVDEAHQRGIVHRDLKPSNIRVDRRGEPHVLDFGLARLTDPGPDDPMQASITQSGQMVGSLPWFSPEQANNSEDSVDSRSDVYSLGVMLYQSITGKFPYKVEGSLEHKLRHIATAIPIPPSGSRQMPSRADFRALDGITLKALAKNPSDRYSSACGFAEDLENYLSGRPTGRPPRQRLSRATSIKCAIGVAALCTIFAWAGLAGSRSTGGPPVVAELPKFVNGGITFLRIPVGSLPIGSPVTEVGRGADETFHKVTFKKYFWMSTTDVTQKQFSLFMGFNPSDPKFLGDSLPVQRVTWSEAQKFCRKLGLSSRRKCRLPTEAEWEYACRATERAPFGNGVALDDAGWWSGNSNKTLHAVATKRPNFWGLYDMHGGVAEWCLDPYRPYPRFNEPLVDPLQTDADRVIRGGSFLTSQAACRAAARAKAPPETRSSDLGFRVVCDDSGTTPPAGS